LRKLLLATLACVIVLTAALFAGPVASGALLLLLPSPGPKTSHDLPDSYPALHQGHVDLSMGFYVRENEDLVVRGTPPLILRRVYVSGWRYSKQFGIGAMHDGERYIAGDGTRFQWAELIRPGEPRIRFERTSFGTSFLNAMYEHRASAGEWQGARLGWTGMNWAMRKRDGSVMLFQACGRNVRDRDCSIIWERDADGHVIHYRRNNEGRLVRIEAEDTRGIAFDYDDQDRIVRAYDSAQHEIRYEYDARGRLSGVSASDGRVHRYTYTDRDEIATMIEPGTDIENTYDADGRCVRQVNRFQDREPYIFDITYVTKGNAVVQTDSRRSDGTWVRYTFNERSYTTSEAWGSTETESAVFTYERDPSTNSVTALTLTCPDRRGIPLRHGSLVRPGREEWIKRDLMQTHCSWTRARWRGAQ
jgi:YD repeat-containing protein